MTWWATIGEVFKFLNTLLPILIGWATARKEREELELKRLKEAQAAEDAAYKRAAENQARSEQSNIAAFDLCMEIAQKDTRDIILKYLNSGHPEKAVALLKMIDEPKINRVMRSDKSNEVKAIRLTNIKFGLVTDLD